LKSDYDHELSFANVPILATAKIIVIESSGDMSIEKGLYLATRLLSREFDYINHQQESNCTSNLLPSKMEHKNARKMVVY
jgi:hypothetical protein